MSGGHYEYFYSKVNSVVEEMEDFQRDYPEPFREKVIQISKLYSDLMHALEWVDSGDTGPDDMNKSLNDFMQKVREL